MADSAPIRLVSWFLLSSPPAPQVRTESQSLTSTLMAQRPMARTAFRTKSTSTSVAYSLSSAKTCGPNREDGVGGIWWGNLLEYPSSGDAQTPRRTGFCLLLEVEVLRETTVRCPKGAAGKH